MPLTHIDRTDPPSRRLAFGGAVTAAAAAALIAVWRRWGPSSRTFALAAVWVPMAWLGTLSRVLEPRLPEAVHRLRPWEVGGARVYELVGVRVVKAVVRRGPVAAFNQDLHLPRHRTPESIAELDAHMRTAEAAHAVAGGMALATATWAAATGRRRAARWMIGCNLVLNGAPIVLQRYNRGLLAGRFGLPADETSSVTDVAAHRPRRDAT